MDFIFNHWFIGFMILAGVIEVLIVAPTRFCLDLRKSIGVKEYVPAWICYIPLFNLLTIGMITGKTLSKVAAMLLSCTSIVYAVTLIIHIVNGMPITLPLVILTILFWIFLLAGLRIITWDIADYTGCPIMHAVLAPIFFMITFRNRYAIKVYEAFQKQYKQMDTQKLLNKTKQENANTQGRQSGSRSL